MASSTARLASSSTLRSEFSVSLVGLSESAVTRVPWGTVTATARYCAVGVARAAEDHRVGVGAERAGVAPDPDAGL